MNYTKGIWKALPSGIGGTPYYIETSDLNIAQISGVRSNKESRANAHLIAAAPVMYEALKVALLLSTQPILQGNADVQMLTNTIKAALAKAEAK